jgi:hypothetical protein
MVHLRKVAIVAAIIVVMGVPVDRGGCDSEVPNSPPGPTMPGPSITGHPVLPTRTCNVFTGTCSSPGS